MFASIRATPEQAKLRQEENDKPKGFPAEFDNAPGFPTLTQWLRLNYGQLHEAYDQLAWDVFIPQKQGDALAKWLSDTDIINQFARRIQCRTQDQFQKWEVDDAREALQRLCALGHKIDTKKYYLGQSAEGMQEHLDLAQCWMHGTPAMVQTT